MDLLHLPGSAVAVSSTVANARIPPEHLLDGRLDTAWNSRGGDLNGWIGFRVPAGAQVVSIRLTVGFTRASQKEDLFLMNHRIKRVRVTHNGAVAGEHSLDVERRDLQEIRLDRPGGVYFLEVLETVAGTKRRWHELCVSELQVMGQPPPGSSAVKRADRPVFVGVLPPAGAIASPLLKKVHENAGTADVVLVCGPGGIFAASVDGKRSSRLARLRAAACAIDPLLHVAWLSVTRGELHDLYLLDLWRGGAPVRLVRGSPVPVGVAHAGPGRPRWSFRPRRGDDGGDPVVRAFLELTASAATVKAERWSDPIQPSSSDSAGALEQRARRVERLKLEHAEVLRRCRGREAALAPPGDRRPRLRLALDPADLPDREDDGTCGACGSAAPIPGTPFYRVLVQEDYVYGDASFDAEYRLYDPRRKVFLETTDPGAADKKPGSGPSFAGIDLAASGRAYLHQGVAFTLGGGTGYKAGPARLRVTGAAGGWLTGSRYIK